MLQDLGKALSELIADSPEVTETLDEIHREGYRLSLLVDCSMDSDDSQSSADFDDASQEGLGIQEIEGFEEVEEVQMRRRPDPVFQINTGDLAFFRSIGIDPTQKLRKRRSS